MAFLCQGEISLRCDSVLASETYKAIIRVGECLSLPTFTESRHSTGRASILALASRAPSRARERATGPAPIARGTLPSSASRPQMAAASSGGRFEAGQPIGSHRRLVAGSGNTWPGRARPSLVRVSAGYAEWRVWATGDECSHGSGISLLLRLDWISVHMSISDTSW